MQPITVRSLLFRNKVIVKRNSLARLAAVWCVCVVPINHPWLADLGVLQVLSLRFKTLCSYFAIAALHTKGVNAFQRRTPRA